MATVLLTSGYPAQVVAAARKHWQVLEIPSHAEALRFLRSAEELPDAVSIGHAAAAEHAEGLPAPTMLAEVQKVDPTLPVIISTGQARPNVIVDLVKRGAFDYVVEPAQRFRDASSLARYTQDLVLALSHAVQWRSLVKANRRRRRERVSASVSEAMQVRSPIMLDIMEMVHKVAPTSATVLITGESGTGKELIARAIHDRSPGHGEPFTALNCGALNQQLLTSELFGHVRGAFTGAETDREGLIREAGMGTLFLDEIGTVTPAFQVMLLRVLDQRRARPVGGDAEYPVRCRFIAAANQDLERMVRVGEFREDFFYRLNMFRVRVPPLRERREEVPMLAHAFLRQAAAGYDKAVVGIEPSAMALLESYSWPGNVRQLRNAVERAVILCDGSRIGVADLDPQVRGGAASDPAEAGLGYQSAMRRFERRLLESALQRAGGNASQAARILDMKRSTLNYRLKQVGLR